MDTLLRDLFTGAEDEAQKSRSKTDRQKQSDTATWQGVLHGGPEIDNDHRMKAATELAKLHGLKKGENPYEKVALVLNTLGSHLRDKTPQAGDAAASSAPSGVGLHPLSSAPAAVSGGIVDTAKATMPSDPQREKVDADSARIQEKSNAVGGGLLKKIGHGLNVGLTKLDQGIDTVGKGLMKAHIIGDPKKQPGKLIDYYTGSDGKRHDIFQRPDGSTYESSSEAGVAGTGTGKKIDSYVGTDGKKRDIFQRTDGSTYESASEEGVRETGSARPVYGPPMSIRNARELAQQGMEFMGEDGKPIDVTSLPDEMGLKRFTVSGKTIWVPFSPNEKVVTVGNEKYAISPMDVGALTQGAGTDLGQANVGSTNTPGYVGIDQQGNVQRVAGQRTPGTKGVKQSGGLTPLESGATPKAVGAGAGAGASAGKPKAQTGGGKKGDLPLPMSSYGKQADRATGVHLAQAALKQFSDRNLEVFDNPESVEKLKNIIGYIQKTADQQIGTGKGPLGAVETWAGLPTAMNQAQQQLLQDQAIKLTDRNNSFWLIISTSSVAGRECGSRSEPRRLDGPCSSCFRNSLLRDSSTVHAKQKRAWTTWRKRRSRSCSPSSCRAWTAKNPKPLEKRRDLSSDPQR
jgi:hypothetical protein